MLITSIVAIAVIVIASVTAIVIVIIIVIMAVAISRISSISVTMIVLITVVAGVYIVVATNAVVIISIALILNTIRMVVLVIAIIVIVVSINRIVIGLVIIAVVLAIVVVSAITILIILIANHILPTIFIIYRTSYTINHQSPAIISPPSSTHRHIYQHTRMHHFMSPPLRLRLHHHHQPPSFRSHFGSRVALLLRPRGNASLSGRSPRHAGAPAQRRPRALSARERAQRLRSPCPAQGGADTAVLE